MRCPGRSAVFQYEQRFPFYGYNRLWNVSASLTRVAGAHNIKTGVFVEDFSRPGRQRSAFNGTINFSADGSNPLNTNVGFANALVGAITSYQKSDVQPTGDGAFVNVEFYAQDNWRVTRTFTIDAGVRFYVISPTRNRDGLVTQFEPEQFDPSAAPAAFSAGHDDTGPARTESADRRSVSGGVYRQAGPWIGRFGQWDAAVRGNAAREFAIRGRAPSRVRLGRHGRRPDGASRRCWRLLRSLRGQQPAGARRDPAAGADLHHELHDDRGAPGQSARPRLRTRSGDSPPFVPPVVYNWSLGVQREIAWKIVADVAYVANAARNQLISRELNGRPYGYAYQPSSLDSTNAPDGQPQPLPDDLLRPYRGYGSILEREFTGYSDYHSMQFSLNRRRSTDGLSFGAAYTYQIVNRTLGAIDPFLPDNRARNYNSAGRRPHTFTVHYSYSVPNLARTAHPAWRALADYWQISGVTTVLSGAQGGFTYTYLPVPTGTLSGNGSIGGGPNRPRIVCDPTLPRSQRTFERQFRTECIAAPDDPFNFGTARGDEFHGPGFVNWDISAFKSIPLGGSRRLQLRAELYNAFNKSFWTTATRRRSSTTGPRALTNPTVFGSLTGATTSARRIQLAARFTF